MTMIQRIRAVVIAAVLMALGLVVIASFPWELWLRVLMAGLCWAAGGLIVIGVIAAPASPARPATDTR